MTLGHHISDALGRIGLDGQIGTPTLDVQCEGSVHHSPTPLVVKQVMLPDGHTFVWLCGTCADNLSVLLWLMESAEGVLPWPVRREFGNRIRALAEGTYQKGASDE